jgi:hypothetical protein
MCVKIKAKFNTAVAQSSLQFVSTTVFRHAYSVLDKAVVAMESNAR